jgi:hypothetical protein
MVGTVSSISPFLVYFSLFIVWLHALVPMGANDSGMGDMCCIATVGSPFSLGRKYVRLEKIVHNLSRQASEDIIATKPTIRENMRELKMTPAQGRLDSSRV